MLLLNIIVGVFFIGIGFLTISFPDLIAGYNTMSKEKKKNVDIAGLSKFMRNGFIVLGAILIISSLLLKAFHLENIMVLVMISIMLIGITFIVVRAQKFDKNKRKNNFIIYIAFGFIFLLTIGIISSAYIPMKTIFKDDQIQFTGNYGLDVDIREIESVELLNQIPSIQLRTNGVSIGRINKGTFKLDSWGKSRLLLNSDKPPFLVITLKNGEKIIINNKDKSKTEETYTYIESRL